jgi:hypothetical protein
MQLCHMINVRIELCKPSLIFSCFESYYVQIFQQQMEVHLSSKPSILFFKYIVCLRFVKINDKGNIF